MFENIQLLRTSGLMARHATIRQKLISENIANSNSPNYTPRDVVVFKDVMARQGSLDTAFRSRAGHFDWEFHMDFQEDKSGKIFETKPNGNSVSVEGEILKSIEVEQQHSQALAIYQHSIDLLKMSIGRGR